MKRTAFLLSVAVMVLGPSAAMADWSDGFETYDDQQLLFTVTLFRPFLSVTSVGFRAFSDGPPIGAGQEKEQ